jgi:nucleotidyltransferase/DNA polymerase involved in DNA repair
MAAASFARLRDYVGRGVITTATYEARALGVASAMGIMKAARLAPDAILLPVDFPAYRHHSRLFKTAVARIAPECEDRGIDEIYLDLSALADESRSLAQRIKDAVREATGLSCSIGVAPNKLLAKIASDLDKPDGLTILGGDDLRQRIWPLPVRKINGIGPKASERLAMLGIDSIGELAQTDGRCCGSTSVTQLRRLAARRRARHRRATAGHRRGGRNRSVARRPSRVTCIRATTARRSAASSSGSAAGWPTICSASAAAAGRSASSCALPTSVSSRAT